MHYEITVIVFGCERHQSIECKSTDIKDIIAACNKKFGVGNWEQFFVTHWTE